jgi:hypothetical protein
MAQDELDTGSTLLHYHHLSRQISHLLDRIKATEKAQGALQNSLDAAHFAGFEDLRNDVEKQAEYMIHNTSLQKELRNEVEELHHTADQLRNVLTTNAQDLDDIPTQYQKNIKAFITRAEDLEKQKQQDSIRISHLEQQMQRLEEANQNLLSTVDERLTMLEVQGKTQLSFPTPAPTKSDRRRPAAPCRDASVSQVPDQNQHLRPIADTAITIDDISTSLAISQQPTQAVTPDGSIEVPIALTVHCLDYDDDDKDEVQGVKQMTLRSGRILQKAGYGIQQPQTSRIKTEIATQWKSGAPALMGGTPSLIVKLPIGLGISTKLKVSTRTNHVGIYHPDDKIQTQPGAHDEAKWEVPTSPTKFSSMGNPHLPKPKKKPTSRSKTRQTRVSKTSVRSQQRVRMEVKDVPK